MVRDPSDFDLPYPLLSFDILICHLDNGNADDSANEASRRVKPARYNAPCDYARAIACVRLKEEPCKDEQLEKLRSKKFTRADAAPVLLKIQFDAEFGRILDTRALNYGRGILSHRAPPRTSRDNRESA